MKKTVITKLLVALMLFVCTANTYATHYNQLNQYIIHKAYQIKNHIKPLNKKDEWNRTKAYFASGFGFYGLGTFLSARYKKNSEKGSRSFSIKPNILTRSLKSLGKTCMLIPFVKLFSDLCYSNIEENQQTQSAFCY